MNTILQILLIALIATIVYSYPVEEETPNQVGLIEVDSQGIEHSNESPRKVRQFGFGFPYGGYGGGFGGFGGFGGRYGGFGFPYRHHHHHHHHHGFHGGYYG